MKHLHCYHWVVWEQNQQKKILNMQKRLFKITKINQVTNKML
jgi:hypothetical protein